MAASIFYLMVLGAFLSAVPVTIVSATKVTNCLDKSPGSMTHVEVSGCEVAPCLLRKNTSVDIEIQFKPENDVSELRNAVSSRIGGISLPFFGVDGASACDKIYQERGTIRTGCPLKAGQEYVYKTSIQVLPMYPSISSVVHWALLDVQKKENVVCFEVKSKIVSQ